MDNAIDDVEFLARSKNRVAILEALHDAPASRGDLQEHLDIDRVTLGRILEAFKERGWIMEGETAYETTFVGELVATQFGTIQTTMRGARNLRPLVGRLPAESFDFGPEHLVDATVTTAGTGDPYAPLRRFIELTEETEALRGYDTTTIAPMYVDELREKILEGMETDIVFLPPVLEQLVADYRAEVAEAIASGHLTLWCANELPCGLAIFDDRVGIGAYHPQSGLLDVFLDTADPAVRSWALDSFTVAREAAIPFTDWLDEPLE
jgi:predicted transcriptional regulator